MSHRPLVLLSVHRGLEDGCECMDTSGGTYDQCILPGVDPKEKKSGKAEVGSPKEPTFTMWTYFVPLSVIHSSYKVYFFLKLCQDNF